MDNPSPMTHSSMREHVFHADVISASQNMLWVFPGVIPQAGKPMRSWAHRTTDYGKKGKVDGTSCKVDHFL